MKFPNEPRKGEPVADAFSQLLRWVRANNVVAVSGGMVRESPNGKTLIVKPSAGGGAASSPAAYTPWKPTFYTTGTPPSVTYQVRFNLGSCNNVIPSNWDDEHTAPAADAVKFVVLNVTTASGKVTGLTISLDSTAPGEDVIAKDTPPTTHKIVLGAISRSSAQMIVSRNLSIVAAEVYRESKASPATGGEPFSRWWRWTAAEIPS